MSSKKDYNRVINKAAKRGMVIESIAAGISAAPDNVKRESMAIATDPHINRQRAIKKFDAKAESIAKKRKP